MIGSPDKGQKPAVPNRLSNGNGGYVIADNDNDFDRGSRADDMSPRVSLESAQGYQTSPRPMFKAPETSTKPVVPDTGRSTTGWVRSEDDSKAPLIPS